MGDIASQVIASPTHLCVQRVVDFSVCGSVRRHRDIAMTSKSVGCREGGMEGAGEPSVW